MGAWGANSFDNDEALDWLADFLDEGDPFFIHNTLEIIADFPGTERPESWDCSCTLAAAEMVAAARGNPPSQFPREADNWLKKGKLELDEELVLIALKAVTRVRSVSELKEVWDESGEATPWYDSVDDLLARLS